MGEPFPHDPGQGGTEEVPSMDVLFTPQDAAKWTFGVNIRGGTWRCMSSPVLKKPTNTKAQKAGATFPGGFISEQ